MSSLPGARIAGNRSRSALDTSAASSTDSVVCIRKATRSPSRGRSLATSSAVCTRTIESGASPRVPSTSSWPSWPMNATVYPSAANRRASACTLDTSGQGASVTASPRHGAPAGHLVKFAHDHRAAVLELAHHPGVVHDLLAHVDRPAADLERPLDDL